MGKCHQSGRPFAWPIRKETGAGARGPEGGITPSALVLSQCFRYVHALKTHYVVVLTSSLALSIKASIGNKE